MNYDPIQSSDFNGFGLPYIDGTNMVYLNNCYLDHMRNKSKWVDERVGNYKSR